MFTCCLRERKHGCTTAHAFGSMPIRTVYYYLTDNKIGLRLSVCPSVCLSVCNHSHGPIFLSIFTKIDTEV